MTKKSSPSGTRERTLGGACSAPVLPNYEDLSARQQNGVDHVDDAVRLVHVADGDLSRAAFGVPDPELAVLLGEGEVGALDGLEHGLSVTGLDLFHQVVGAQTARDDVIGEHVGERLLVLGLEQ